MIKRELELGGMVDKVVTRATALRPTQEGARIDGEFLLYRGVPVMARVLNVDRALLDFCALHEDRNFPEAVKAFALRHGVLELNSNGLTRMGAVELAALGSNVSKNPEFQIPGKEPLEAWRQLSREFAAHVRIASNLYQGTLGSASDWELIQMREFADRPTVNADKRSLERSLQWLVSKSELRPTFVWSGGNEASPQIRFAGHGLYDFLVLALMYRLARVRDEAVCDACRCLFAMKRRPPRGILRFCDECKKRGLHRAVSTRAWRERKRAEEREKDATPAPVAGKGKRRSTKRSTS